MNDLISVIVCSADDTKFGALAQNYAEILASEPYEIVRISDARSLCEGYNRGVGQSHGDVLLFTHDDVEVLSEDLASKLRQYLTSCDIVGVAGTDRLIAPNWIASGPPHIFGQVSHVAPGGYTVCLYGAPQSSVNGIEAMDGLLLAARREVCQQVPFDEDRFDGFHLYDLDFTYSAFQAGFRLVVANDIRVIHGSGGSYGPEWERYGRTFREKHGARLHTDKPRRFNFAAVFVETRQEVIELTTPSYWGDAQDASAERDRADEVRVEVEDGAGHDGIDQDHA